MPQWRRRRGGQLKTWLDVIKADLTSFSGPEVYSLQQRWKRELMEISKNLAQDRKQWAAVIRDVKVNGPAQPAR